MSSFESLLKEVPRLIENDMVAFFKRKNYSSNIIDPLLYAVKTGGKKLRPILFFATLEMFGYNYKQYINLSTGIEMIHLYSLVHDDLPAMDDDDLRRGKPTLHKQFDEATAILTGDALLTHAFEIVATSNMPLTPNQKIEAISLMSELAGATGMIEGQYLDLQSENKNISENELELIHEKKTGQLLKLPIELACVVSNVSLDTRKQLIKFAEILGKSFQIKDDLLDVEATTEVLGKPVGSDEKNDKQTYPKIFGVEKSKDILKKHIKDAKVILDDLGYANSILLFICEYISNREF